MKITVVGLGYIGLPVAIMLAEAGHQIIGYEIDNQRLESIKQREFNHQEPTLYSRFDLVSHNLILTNELLPSDTYIITVQTPNDRYNKADLSFVKSALDDVAKYLKRDDMIILESTVPPYSNLDFQRYVSQQSKLSLNEFDYVYCPETIQPGNVFFELGNNSRVIGTVSTSAFKRAKDIYASITKGQISETSFIVAEHVKIMQNSYRDYEIAFANALSIYCDEHKMDVFELINLINQHPRAKILSPGVGVGGHCLPVDPLFITEHFIFEPISFSRKTNDEKTIYAAKKIMSYSPSSVVIFGASYKPNSDDIRHSPSIRIAQYLRSKGVDVSFCEPNIIESKIEGFINHDLEIAISLKSVFVIAQKHQIFVTHKSLFEFKTTIDFVGLF